MISLHYYTVWVLSSLFILFNIDYLPATGLQTYTNAADFLMRAESNELPLLTAYPL
jgi:hypothetical protein